MNRRLLLAAIAVVGSGCFFDDIDFGGRACDPNDACPEGLSCDATTHTCERGDLSKPCIDPADAGTGYVIHRLPAGAVINLATPGCDETFWSSVPPINFTGLDTSDNQQTCRVVWNPGPPDVLYGCCDVIDHDLRAHKMVADDIVYLDDGIEYLLKNDLTQVFDVNTSKIQINILGVVADANYLNGTHNSVYDAQVVARPKLVGTLNDMLPDTSYSIKWRANVGFGVAAPQIGYCDFMINDLDLSNGVEVRTTWTAFGNIDNDNDPTKWGSCLLSCNAP